MTVTKMRTVVMRKTLVDELRISYLQIRRVMKGNTRGAHYLSRLMIKVSIFDIRQLHLSELYH